ncbi:MAG: hypothetical protein HC896_00210 [Bacteroidales bacterium]|nr:hypothetical protein [Bacteroidales bacterium]
MKKQPLYYYAPRFNLWSVYKNNLDGSATCIKSQVSKDEAKELTHTLNGWKQ